MESGQPGDGAISDTIDSAEKLGRGVFSSQDKRAAENRKYINPELFIEDGLREISTDRLTLAPPDEAVRLGDERAAGRGPNRSFYGWAIVIASTAGRKGSGRNVTATPLKNGTNPYHADIVLPVTILEDKEEHLEHAKELSLDSCWEARP